MPDAEYKLKLSGPGITIDQAVTQALAQKIVLAVFGADALTAASTPVTPAAVLRPPASGGGHDLSIAEFVSEAKAGTAPEKIAAFASFMKQHEKKETFTKAELEQAFEAAADTIPGNLHRDVKAAVRLGWIAPTSGQKGSYYVTGTGTRLVGSKFEGGGSPRSGRASTARKSRAKGGR